MNVTRSRRIALAAAAALLGGALILSSSPASGATASPCTDPAQISVGSAAPRLETPIQVPGGFSMLSLGAGHNTEALREALAGVACAVAVPAPTVESGEVLQPAPLTGVKSSKSPNCRVV